MHHATRAEWRDALKAPHPDLNANDVLVGLLIADYWKVDSDEPIWAVVDVLIAQSRLSRASVFRAIRKLRDAGFLHQVEAARHGRSPRWEARIGSVQSHTETNWSPTETDQSHSDTRNHTQTRSTPDVGSKDLDCESRPAFSAEPQNAREHADYALLRSHMHNYNAESVARVYAWLRSGERTGRNGNPGKPWQWPGATARSKHLKPTNEEGVSEWQGLFRRNIALRDERTALPKIQTLYVADPWASKSA